MLSPLFAACCSMLVTLGSKHLVLTPQQDALLATPWMRVAVLFAIAFLATNDLQQSALLAFLAWLLLDIATNERSGLVPSAGAMRERLKRYARRH